MKFSRDAWLAIGLFLLLAAITALAAVRGMEAPVLPELASESTAPNGARALWLWLEDLGYQPTHTTGGLFRVPEEAVVLLVLEPGFPFASGDWREIDDWVKDGGTAIFASDGPNLGSYVRHYDLFLSGVFSDDPLTLQTPLFNSPPFRDLPVIHPEGHLGTLMSFKSFGLEPFVPLVGVGDSSSIISIEKGKGRVILSAITYPFTNQGLKDSANRVLVLNLISAAGSRGVVMFDEWHHGLRSAEAEIAGPSDWLFATPAGRAILFVVGAIFLALLFRGQRFGRPVPPAKELVRRAPLEYITAIANLSRRAGHRAAVLRQYHQNLKRALGERYRLSPDMPDAQYAAQLGAYNPAVDEKRLADLLGRLSRRNVSESEMLQMAGEVADWTKGH